MLSPVIKKKVHARYKQEIKYAKQCDAFAAHISTVCKCKISSSTIKRLWGFTGGPETKPRIWTLDIIAEYLGYKSFDDLQHELAGNKQRRKKRIEFIDCSQVQPGKKILIRFGKIVSLKIESLGKHRFNVLEEIKTELQRDDEIELEKIQIDLPLLVKVQRSGTTTSGIILGGVTGVTEIVELDKTQAQFPSRESK